ncbi:MAG: hypothetical protein A3K60_06135 [Euryarchaeota archaeon RBG_19FT_COMBO_56_21]|nr:MAG: hypothetical protein A3K60_06135 [Euryarchaeota archaeon RBG_19FT_COMBO_56_21]
MKTAIALEDVSKKYNGVVALKGASFAVSKGEVFGIVGPSGAGKSTILRIMDLLEAPTKGRLLIDGQYVAQTDARAETVRRNIGMVLQKPVVLNRSVANNLGYSLMIRGWDEHRIAEVVDAELKRLGLHGRRRTNARNLSGGEMQRLCFARATVHAPSMLLLDEFAANLDPANVSLLENQVQEYMREDGNRTVVIVTHNMFQAKRMCTRIALIWDGEIVEIADRKKFFENPEDARTAAFVSGESVY